MNSFGGLSAYGSISVDLAPAFMKESGRMLNLIQTERAERADVMSLKDAPESDGNTSSQV